MKKISNHFTLCLFVLLFSSNTLLKSQIDFTVIPTVCAGSSQTLTAQVGTLSIIAYTWAVLPAGPVFSNPGGSTTNINFPASGTYTIGLGALHGSGYSYTTQVVNVLPLPVVGLTQSQATTCIASNFPIYSHPIHLIASGAANYTWFPTPSITPTINSTLDVRPTTSTCYTVVGSAGGCVGSASICVTVIPQFSIEVSPNPALRCLPDSAILSIIVTDTLAVGPASAFTYSWTETTSTLTTMSGYFTQTVSVFPPTASSYTAEVFDSRNCISFPKTVNVDVQNCTGIQTNKFHAMSFSLYPNPVVDYLYWHSETKDISLVKIEISNAIGQVVYRQVNPTEEKADLKFLPSGFYYLSVFTKNEKQSFRFVKD